MNQRKLERGINKLKSGLRKSIYRRETENSLKITEMEEKIKDLESNIEDIHCELHGLFREIEWLKGKHWEAK